MESCWSKEKINFSPYEKSFAIATFSVTYGIIQYILAQMNLIDLFQDFGNVEEYLSSYKPYTQVDTLEISACLGTFSISCTTDDEGKISIQMLYIGHTATPEIDKSIRLICCQR